MNSLRNSAEWCRPDRPGFRPPPMSLERAPLEHDPRDPTVVRAARCVHRPARACVRADCQISNASAVPQSSNPAGAITRPGSAKANGGAIRSAPPAPPSRSCVRNSISAISSAQPNHPNTLAAPAATPFDTNRRVLALASWHADPEPDLRAHAERLRDVKGSISTPPLLSTVRQTRGLAALVAMSLLAPPFPERSSLRRREAPSVEGRARAR